MTLRNLQIFATVAECCNMTKAAEKLYISQPSVSMAVSDIEREYDVSLFDRMGGKLSLTPTGRIMLTHAERVLSAEHQLDSFLREESANVCVRIGVTVTIGSTIFSSILAEMKKEMPHVNYHVMVANTQIIEKQLMNADIDIALVEGEIDNASLEVTPVIHDKLVLICSSKHPFSAKESLELRELADVPLILREEGSGAREYFKRMMQSAGIPFTVRWSSYSHSAIIDAVEHDLGVGVISGMLARKYSGGGRLHICEIADVELDRSFKLVYKKSKFITSILMRFTQICGNTKYFNMAPEQL